MSINFKYKLSKNYVVLVCDEKVPRHFWRIAIVTEILPSRGFDIERSDREKEKGQCNPQTFHK